MVPRPQGRTASEFSAIRIIGRNRQKKMDKLLFRIAPSSLVATIFFSEFFFELQKKFFFLSGQAFNPPPFPLSGRATKKQELFCGLLSILLHGRRIQRIENCWKKLSIKLTIFRRDVRKMPSNYQYFTSRADITCHSTILLINKLKKCQQRKDAYNDFTLKFFLVYFFRAMKTDKKCISLKSLIKLFTIHITSQVQKIILLKFYGLQ